jgi:predicted GNAT family acetyltransferase
MKKGDVQIGDVWTHPLFRGKGIASKILETIVADYSSVNKRIWYIVEETNLASIKVVEKCGFDLIGYALKYPRYGCSFLGYYDFFRFITIK